MLRKTLAAAAAALVLAGCSVTGTPVADRGINEPGILCGTQQEAVEAAQLYYDTVWFDPRSVPYLGSENSALRIRIADLAADDAKYDMESVLTTFCQEALG